MLRARACLLIVLLFAGCAPPHDPHPRPSLTVRAMSFNLRWDGFDDGKNAWRFRRDLVFRVLREFRPDSVGTQEPMIRQIADIEKAIPTLASYRFDNDPKFVRTQQVLYRNDRFERVDAGGFLLAEGTNEEGTVRYCTWVRLSDRASGRCYTHYNVHLDHRHRRSRELSAVRLMKQIAYRQRRDPFLVTGDFNAPEDGPTMAFLFGRRTLPDEDGTERANPIPLVDTYRVLYPETAGSGTASGFRGRRTGAKIDHVLVAAGAAVIREASIIRTNADGRYPSDHFPVVAVIEWP